MLRVFLNVLRVDKGLVMVSRMGKRNLISDPEQRLQLVIFHLLRDSISLGALASAVDIMEKMPDADIQYEMPESVALSFAYARKILGKGAAKKPQELLEEAARYLAGTPSSGD